MVKKRILSTSLLLMIITTFLLAFTGCSAKTKVSLPTVKEDVYIYDQDNCIDDEVEQKLNQMLVDLEEKTEVEFAVISITSLNDLSIEEYATKLFNELGIGKKGKDNGLLLLFSRSDKRVRIAVGRGLEGCLNDAKCGRILDDYFVPYREYDKYTEATDYTVQAALAVIAEEYDIQIENLQKDLPAAEKKNTSTWCYTLIILVLIILAIIVVILDDGSSSGGYYGGGFSGGSSGGSFGGGFTGGGGASR